jgi:hypothetical protein
MPRPASLWQRGEGLNLRPSGYESGDPRDRWCHLLPSWPGLWAFREQSIPARAFVCGPVALCMAAIRVAAQLHTSLPADYPKASFVCPLCPPRTTRQIQPIHVR